ncbi:two component system sensor kinase [Serratia marcescens]|uniref:two component system sensor kinase n=2 Tax=Serratia TaxID=613 RepID=UPI000666B2EB|nr:two component system sensor kinase [Serratia marcescens]HEJ7054889.1 two component system sensor kinase [Serratia marcescens]
MRMHSSLVFRLTIFLSLSLMLIWLVSVLTTVFFSLSHADRHVIDELSHLASLRVELSNHRFEGAERDAQDLARRYDSFCKKQELNNISGKSDSRYLPINSKACHLNHAIHRDNWFIQAYGSAGQTYYLDSFLLKPAQGISLYPPEKITDDYFSQRRLGLSQFQTYPHHDNIYWGNPEYLSGSGWSISVAAGDKAGGLIGYAIRLDDLLSYGHTVTDFDVNIWLDRHQQPLPFFRGKLPAAEEEIIFNSLKKIKLRDGWQRIPGYRVLRIQLKGPGWQQVVLYPDRGILEEAAEQAKAQLPFALGILLLITLALFWMLRRYLAQPLWQFVDVICQTSAENFYPRLLEHRRDELGQIAIAYNRLLDKLNQQYATLEKKVVERTRALKEAKRKAELANKRKSRHLTAISHELRTPLNGTLGALELLRTGDMDQQQQWLADTAHQCTLSLIEIINQLLDFSRIEAGQIELQSASCQLLPLLDQAMMTIQGAAQSKGLVLSVHLAANVPHHLCLDALRVRQILVNLLGNACKFTDQGHITMQVERVGKTLVFNVEDSGRGVSEEHLASVFMPFYQAQTHAQGTGLGLTIAATLAKMMGGRLDFSSILGRGSRVAFHMPLGQFSEPEPLCGVVGAPAMLHPQLLSWGISCLTQDPAEGGLNTDLAFLPGRLHEAVKCLLADSVLQSRNLLPLQPWRLRVLLVDDTATNRDIISVMLARLGQEVHQAENARQALQLGREHRFDVVLMDLQMPDCDGLTLARSWRDDAQGQDGGCMIVALSAHTGAEEKGRAIRAGMNDYLAKPVTLSQLSQLLELVAEYQISRDISIINQLDTGKPILAMDDGLIGGTVTCELRRLLVEAEQTCGRKTDFAKTVHTIKGICGQAGLSQAMPLIVELERQILAKETPQQERLVSLLRLIRTQLNID